MNSQDHPMKPVIVDPKTTARAEAYALWMDAPNPMVTFFKTLDVTPLVRLSRKKRLKFNMLLCWCIGRAVEKIREFYTLPVGRDLLRYDTLAVNTIVKNRNGEVTSCDIPYSSSLTQFIADYLRLTREAAERCENHDLTDSMVIGTSAIVDTELDGAVGMNSGIFNTPFLIWGRYHRGIFKSTLKLSFQFHHTQMDGAHAGRFLRRLQESICGLKAEQCPYRQIERKARLAKQGGPSASSYPISPHRMLLLRGKMGRRAFWLTYCNSFGKKRRGLNENFTYTQGRTCLHMSSPLNL